MSDTSGVELDVDISRGGGVQLSASNSGATPRPVVVAVEGNVCANYDVVVSLD